MEQKNKSLQLEKKNRDELIFIKEQLLTRVKEDRYNFTLWLELGNVLRRLGEYNRAQDCYTSACNVKSDDYRGYLALARLQDEMGIYDGVAKNYQKSLYCAKDIKTKILIHQRMSLFRIEGGNISSALDSIRQAQLLTYLDKSDDILEIRCEVYLTISEIYLRLGLHEEAKDILQSASMSNNIHTLYQLSNISFRFNYWNEAVQILQKAVSIEPNNCEVYYNLAMIQAEVSQIDDATQTINKMKILDKDNKYEKEIKLFEARLNNKIGNIVDTFDTYYDVALQNPNDYAIRSSTVMSALYNDNITTNQLSKLHKELFLFMQEGEKPRSSFANKKDKNKVLNIGYISADFHQQHPVNIFMQPLLRVIDKKRFNHIIYYTGAGYDDQTYLAKKQVSKFKDAGHLTYDQFAKQVIDDEIDILIDLSGHTANQRMSYFAKRMAPIQITYLGYPGSTGVPNIDYIIGDKIVTPNEYQHLYTEKILQLDNNVFCYSPIEDYPYPEYTDEHLSRDIVFGTFNNITKLSNSTLRVWARILSSIQNSKLLLKSPSFIDTIASDRYKKIFGDYGISSDRLIFRGPSGLSDMMSEYKDIDIALDPFPYNGGTTTLQAMYMGVPVITKMGEHFVSRMSASFLTNANMSDWIARDDDEYVNIAIQKASNKEELLKLKQNMRQNLLSLDGWNIQKHTISFQNCILTAWNEYCEEFANKGEKIV